MPFATRPMRNCFVLLAALCLAACGSGSSSTVNIVAIGPAGAAFAKGRPQSAAANLVRSATTEGLVGFDKDGRVIPALADRWIVTDDGLSYIFRLRDGVWSDGSEISAESAAAALRQAIASVRGTPLAAELAPIEDIRTMASRVVELRLSSPRPDLLQVLGAPELGLMHDGAGAGPMRLTRDNDTAVLTPISPAERGLPAPENWASQMRRVRFTALSARQAIESFNQGEADVVLGGGFADYPLLDSLGAPGRFVLADPVSGLFGILVVNGKGFLAKPENREAIAMAIDRDGIGAAIGIDDWTATTRVVPAGAEGDSGTVGERWIGRSIADRRAEAASRVARWRNARNPAPELRIALPRGPGADMLFARLRDDLGKVGIALDRVDAEAAADLELVDTLAPFSRVAWYLDRLSCAALKDPCSPSADGLAAQARDAADAAKRVELMAQAEAELTRANVYIPLGAPVRWSLVRGSIEGFAVNRLALHPLLPFAVRQD